MKKLQLWLGTAFICCALMGQSPADVKAILSLPEGADSFQSFTVIPQNGRALLRWTVSSVTANEFFVVEKSQDSVHFEMLSAMGVNAETDSVYSLVDNAVASGTIFYRIRITGKSGKEECSKTVSLNNVPAADFKFYPNPVDKLLIIRSSHALSVQVADAYGVVWFSQELDAGMQIVNVSSLQKGSYILKATDKATNTVISEQLVKNN